MTQYAQHFSTLKTPQSEQADPRQVKNNAGGYTFALDKWARLDRWLILGAEGGTYYVTERVLTRDNAQTIQECLNEDGPRTVATIATVSEQGRAPKNDPAIFALALAAGHTDAATRKAALAALPRVCRTGTHLFQFAESVKAFRGWGRGLRDAVACWYNDKSPDKLAYQLVKYQQRGGWSHRDMLRLAHPDAPDPAYAALYRYVAGGIESLGGREVKRGERTVMYPPTYKLPVFVSGFEQLKHTKDVAGVIRLIKEYGFTHEMVDGKWKGNADVWAALLEHMPMTAMVRNLGKMSQVGLLRPMSTAAGTVCQRLGDASRIRKARVHPVQMLAALLTYKAGHGMRGSLAWEAVPQVVDALDGAFYLAFDNVESTGKRTLLALDLSDSMTWSTIAGVPGLTPRVAAAALAMVTARRESNWHCVGFSCTGGNHWGYGGGPAIQPLTISPRQRLDDVIATIARMPAGGTDCALPMLYAAGNDLDVDVFAIYTDNETWAGNIHPHQALKAYRNKRGINSKLAVVGMTSNGFSIADPNDVGMIDVVGFDTSTPAVLADFARG